MKKFLLLLTIMTMIVWSVLKGGHEQEEQARLTLVEDGVEVYACGSYPVYVKATLWVEKDKDALYPDPFKCNEYCHLKPGEKKILTYNNPTTKVTDLLDYSVTLEEKNYDVTKLAIVIFVVIFFLLIILAFAIESDGTQECLIARCGIFISVFLTLAILGGIRIVAGHFAMGPIIFSVFGTNIF